MDESVRERERKRGREESGEVNVEREETMGKGRVGPVSIQGTLFNYEADRRKSNDSMAFPRVMMWMYEIRLTKVEISSHERSNLRFLNSILIGF